MPWAVEYTPEFEAWWDTLSEERSRRKSTRRSNFWRSMVLLWLVPTLM